MGDIKTSGTPVWHLNMTYDGQCYNQCSIDSSVEYLWNEPKRAYLVDVKHVIQQWCCEKGETKIEMKEKNYKVFVGLCEISLLKISHD